MPTAAEVLAEGLAHQRAGRLDRAEACYRRALALSPGNPNAVQLLGMLEFQRGRLPAAEALLRRAVASRPDIPFFHGNLGLVLQAHGKWDEALAAYGRALALSPADAGLLNSRAALLARMGEAEAAAHDYAASLAAQPDQPEVLALSALLRAAACDWEAVESLLPALRAAIAAGRPLPPFCLLGLEVTAAEQLAASRNWAAAIRDRAGSSPFTHAPQEPGRLSIGYLSADYRDHATAVLIAELFELHDRAKVEVVAVSIGPGDGSPLRRRLEAGADRFLLLERTDPAEAARAIHDAGIHILVDLKGYTADARPEILALRPAPVQMAWLGYPGSLGAEFIDYAIVDPVVCPTGAEAWFDEALIRLPHCYQPNDRKRPLPGPPPARADLGLPEDAVVLAAFNNPFKIGRACFAAWMRVLEAVPGSVLWLLDPGEAGRERLRAAAGDKAGRLVFAPKLPLDRHLTRHGAADLFLDAFPCTGHTTASDALWAGLPLVTLAGGTFAGRVAASLLSAVGLPELAAGTVEEFEALALALARDPARRAALRRHLEAARATAPLFDTPRLARDLERAYAEAWRNWQAGGRARGFTLTAEPC